MKLFELDPVPSQDAEWYTPWCYIEAARAVMGTIDLDPASCAQANEVVRAAQYYTAVQNGLLQPWYGCVWLNCPYGTTGLTDHKGCIHSGESNIKLFSRKLLSTFQEGKIEQAIMLIRADPSASWFPPLWCYPICFLSGNVYFNSPRGPATVKHRFGTCFVYLGLHVEKFIEIFSRFGIVARAIRCAPPPLAQEVQPGLWS